MNFLSSVRDAVNEHLLPDVEERLSQKIGHENRFYVERRLIREKSSDATTEDDPLFYLGEGDVIEETDLLNNGNYIVFGRSGAGKSALALNVAVEAYQRFRCRDDVPFPIFLELGSEIYPGDSQAIWDAFSLAASGFLDAAMEREQGVFLIADALDEMLRGDQRLLGSLDAFLQDLESSGHCRILLTTRRSRGQGLAWRSKLLRRAKSYHVDVADDYEYSQILDDPDRKSDFYQKCHAAGLRELLDSPFDGFDLAFRFRNGKSLPSSRQEHLNQRIDERLRKRRADGRPSVSKSKLRKHASRLACVTSFAKNDPFTDSDVVDILQDGALEDINKDATEREIESLLSCRLFKVVKSETSPRYTFDHAFYKEFLSAEALVELSLRKQRQLLFVQLDGREQVSSVHRGIARMLADRDEAFCTYLCENDSVVAFFSFRSGLTEDEHDRLIERLFAWFTERNVSPWKTVEGTGETFMDVLGWRSHSSPSDFLKPYLSSSKEINRMWGAKAAYSWGGVADLRSELEALALNSSVRTDTRASCVRALRDSCGEDALPTIKSLLFDDFDPVRGAAFGAYQRLASPSVAETFFLLRKPKQQPNLFSSFQREIRAYGQSLTTEDIRQTFYFLHIVFFRQRRESVLKAKRSKTKLYKEMLRRILECPQKIDFESPPVLPVLYQTATWLSTTDKLKEILSDRQDLWRLFFFYAYNRSDYSSTASAWSEILAESAVPGSLNLLPSDCRVVRRSQSWLVEKIRREVGESKPNDRLRNVNLPLSVRRHSVCWLRLPRRGPDMRNIWVERTVIDAISNSDPFICTKRLLEASRLLKQARPCDLHYAVEDLKEWIPSISRVTYQKVIDILRDCVANELSSQAYVHRRWVYSIVKLLIEEGAFLSEETLVLAFKKFCWKTLLTKDAEQLLSSLWAKSESRWRTVVLEAFEHGGEEEKLTALRHAKSQDSSILLGAVQERLRNGSYSSREMHAMLDYFREYVPEGEQATVLWECYRFVRDKRRNQLESPNSSHQSDFSLSDIYRPLLYLMSLGEDDAWVDLQDHIAERSGLMTKHPRVRSLELPSPEEASQVKVLLNWYIKIQLVIDKEGDRHHERRRLASDIMSRITSFEDVAVLGMLREVQSEAPYEKAPWLSGEIIDVEGRLLSELTEERHPMSMLRMIARDRYHDVQSEKDLFEVTCEAIESLQDDFKAGSGVAGFWNTGGSLRKPKREVECQNALWFQMRERLSSYGVSGIEEEVINENYADFRIDYTTRRSDSLSTFVEMKVARKGYGQAELIDPIEAQLYDEHLRPSGCSHGIFLVLWFKDNDSYNYPTKWDSVDHFRNDLQERARQVESSHGVKIATYVLDMTAGYRSR